MTTGSVLKHSDSGGRARRLLRVIGCVTLIGASSVVAKLALARAHGEGLLQSNGFELLAQLGAAAQDAPQQVALNGQRLFLASTLTSLPVPEVLERFQRSCDEGGRALNFDLEQLPRASTALLPRELQNPEKWLVRRSEEPSGNSGQSACFAGARSGGLAALLGAVKEFAQSGELSQLGDARYILARRAEGARATHVLAMWAAGEFNVRAMFPAHGDAPGEDSAMVPRPRQSLRRLSAQMVGQPYALRIYEAERSPASLLEEYDVELTSRGYQRAQLEPSSKDVESSTLSRGFVGDERAVLVVVSPRDSRKTNVVLLELGAAEQARSAEASR